jgi:NADH:ubiquinone oxidoreductase subunit H
VWLQIPLGFANPNVGVLWLLAITSIGTYGIVLAGWASNNKYAMLGGLRASAQMISYELSLGLAFTVPIMLAGSMNVREIIDAQGTIPILSWFVFQNPLAAGIMIVALIAEVNRSPFDLPEAEQELTAGFMTEYSGMKFALFMMAEYLGMMGVSMIAVSMFFGGYHFILVDQLPIVAPLVMIAKVFLFLCGFVWIRATLPRIRYDRLMTFGWKVMLPLALVAVAWSAIAIVIGDVFQSPVVYMIISGLMFVLVVGGALVFFGRAGRVEGEEDGLEDDPLVTGERRGAAAVGYAVLQIVGGLIGILFALVGVLAWVLEIPKKMGEPPSKEIVATEDKSAKRAPAKGSGGD